MKMVAVPRAAHDRLLLELELARKVVDAVRSQDQGAARAALEWYDRKFAPSSRGRLVHL